MSNTPSNPFFDADFSKFMDLSKFMDVSKMMDMSKMMDFSNMPNMMDMSKMMDGCKMPNIDVDAMMATQRKNLEAIASANQKAFESMQSFMQRQAELARQSFEATSSLVQAVIAAPTPEEKVAKQVEATKQTIEGCVSSLKELSEILSQSHLQTVQAVSNRVCESMDEMQGLMKNKG